MANMDIDIRKAQKDDYEEVITLYGEFVEDLKRYVSCFAPVERYYLNIV